LSFHFLLPSSSSFTSFLPERSSCIFGNSLPLEVSIRKLKLSSSIAVILQVSQTAVVLYQLSNSIVSCTSGLLRLQLTSTNFQVQLLAVLPDFSGFNCHLPYIPCSIVTVLPDYSGYNCFLLFLNFTFYGVFFRTTSKVLSLSNSLSIKSLEKNIFQLIDLKDSNPKL
jgi:hypothetical protein